MSIVIYTVTHFDDRLVDLVAGTEGLSVVPFVRVGVACVGKVGVSPSLSSSKTVRSLSGIVPKGFDVCCVQFAERS